VTDAADTAPAARGGFPEVRPVEDAPPELGRFVTAMRQLQDLTVSTNPNSSLWADAAEHLESACALLDGHQVPVPHFGVVLDWDEFHAFAASIKAGGISFVIDPYIRFKGLAGEQATMFFRDPSGNALEFKAFADPTQLFAK